MRATSAQLLDRTRIRAKTIIRRLKKEYPGATTALEHSRPLELLIATILSAQCTDQQVNKVAPSLFQRFRSAADYAKADLKELERHIHSTGFYHAKAKNIINCCSTLIERFNGKVPETIDELIQLPGVGRKTANVVLGMAFGKTEGIVVDTHVKRLSNRLGFSKKDDPEKIEYDLMKIIPKKDWITIGNVLIWHGRKVCNARNPQCATCILNDQCPSAMTFS